jgi:hypothetical protein
LEGNECNLASVNLNYLNHRAHTEKRKKEQTTRSIA